MANPNTTTTQGSIDAPEVVIIPFTFVSLVNAQVRKILVPYAFVVTAAQVRVGSPPTTAAKAATLTVQINGTAVTGGVIALTSANTATSGAAVASTAITANNGTQTAGLTVEVAVSSVTAFVEGDGYVELTLLPVSAG